MRSSTRLAEGRVAQQVAGDVVAEERRAGVEATVLGRDHVEAEAIALGLGGLRVGDDLELGHPVEHDVAALERAVGRVRRVVAGGVLHQAGEHRGLTQVQVVGVDVEVVAGGRLDAVGAVTEVGDVEVALEDPVLRVVLLEGDGVAELVELALIGVGGRCLALGLAVGLLDQGQLDHLLGDRRTTLDGAVAGLVGHERAQRAAEVERAVLVEARVLDRDDRLDHGPRDLVEGDVDAVLVVEGRDDVAVGVEHPGLLRQRVGLELRGQVVHRLRDVVGADPEHAGERDREAGDEDAHDRGHCHHDDEVGEDAGGRQTLIARDGHAPRIRDRS